MQMRKLLLVAAAVTVVAAACAPGSTEDSGHPLGGSHTETRKLVNQPSWAPGGPGRDALIDRADQAYPADSFSGVTADGSAFRIHRVPVPWVAEFDASLRRQHPELQLVFADAPHARATLDEVAASILRDISYWRAEGVAVTAVGPRADGSGVLVMVDRATADLAAAMQERYQFLDLEITEGQVTPASSEPG
jgi:hypothetical protein